MICDYFALFGAYYAALSFRPSHNSVYGLFEFRHAELVFASACGKKSGFVDKVRNVGSDKARGSARYYVKVYSLSYFLVFKVDFENVSSAIYVGTVDYDLPVKASGTQKSRVKYVGAVCRSDKDDSCTSFKTVHFDEKLVKSLFSFVMAAAESRSAVTSDCVDFVYEDYAGLVFARLFK